MCPLKRPLLYIQWWNMLKWCQLRGNENLGPIQDAKNHTSILIHLWWFPLCYATQILVQPDMCPANMGACGIGGYKFRIAHTWTVLSHSHPPHNACNLNKDICIQQFSLSLPDVPSFQRNILTCSSVQSIHSVISNSSEASLCPAEPDLTIFLPPGFTFRIQFFFLLSSNLTGNIQISARHTNFKQTRRHFLH